MIPAPASTVALEPTVQTTPEQWAVSVDAGVFGLWFSDGKKFVQVNVRRETALQIAGLIQAYGARLQGK